MCILIFRQLIYNYPEQLFADAGIMAIEHADFDGIERLALVTGGEIVSTFDNPELVKLGRCDVIEQVCLLVHRGNNVTVNYDTYRVMKCVTSSSVVA